MAVAVWAIALLLASLLATGFCIVLWNRRLQREAEAARRTVEAREAEILRGQEAERRAAEAVAASERRYRALTEAGAIAAWRATPEGRLIEVPGWEALTGQPEARLLVRPDGWLDSVHPEDRAGADAAWRAALREGNSYDREYRLTTASGGWRWCRARAVALRDEETGRILEWVGVVEDVDARRRAEEARMLLSREVSHRAKNVLAVVQGLIRATATDDPEAFASSIHARIAALARAHSLLAEQDWSGAALRTIAERELAPYLGEPALVTIEGEPVVLHADAVQPVAMVLHELATNAAKHGSLSTGGTVRLTWRVEGGTLRILWIEQGGPPLLRHPERQGFGTHLIDASITNSFGGDVERHWLSTGLRCTISLPVEGIVVPNDAAGHARQAEGVQPA